MLQYCSPEKYCKIIVCDIFILDKESATELSLSGDVHFGDPKQLAAVCRNITHKHHTHTDRIHTTDTIESGEYISNCHVLALQNIAFLKRYTGDGAEVKFKSFIHVIHDKQRYVLDSHKQEVC